MSYFTPAFERELDSLELSVKNSLEWVATGAIPAAKEIIASKEFRSCVMGVCIKNVVLLGKKTSDAPRA